MAEPGAEICFEDGAGMHGTAFGSEVLRHTCPGRGRQGIGPEAQRCSADVATRGWLLEVGSLVAALEVADQPCGCSGEICVRVGHGRLGAGTDGAGGRDPDAGIAAYFEKCVAHAWTGRTRISGGRKWQTRSGSREAGAAGRFAAYFKESRLRLFGHVSRALPEEPMRRVTLVPNCGAPLCKPNQRERGAAVHELEDSMLF